MKQFNSDEACQPPVWTLNVLKTSIYKIAWSVLCIKLDRKNTHKRFLPSLIRISIPCSARAFLLLSQGISFNNAFFIFVFIISLIFYTMRNRYVSVVIIGQKNVMNDKYNRLISDKRDSLESGFLLQYSKNAKRRGVKEWTLFINNWLNVYANLQSLLCIMFQSEEIIKKM